MKPALVLLLLLGAAPQESAWKPLFDGKSLDGWETYLGRRAKGEAPLGLNRDPDKVFSVVEIDGAPAIRISGQTNGGISTVEEFQNVHVRAEFRWGEKRWPPRENVGRDSGLFYNAVLPHGAAGGAWLRSVQCNLMEKGCGQWWSVGDTRVDVEGVRVDKALEKEIPYTKESPGESLILYRKGAPVLTATPRDCVTPPIDPEKLRGEWNRVEVICLGPDSVHVINGKVTTVLRNARRIEEGKEVAFTKGRLQLQSEGAEIYFRKIELRPVSEVPREFLPDGELPKR